MQVSAAQIPTSVYHAPTSSASTYADQKRGNRYQSAGKLALGAADLYIAGATAFANTGTLGEIMPWMSGAAAVYHGIKGISQVYAEYGERTPQEYATGTGNFIMAAGFGALAFGLGPWALPIIAIGQAAVLAGDHYGGRR
jgi:hypothetical protein